MLQGVYDTQCAFKCFRCADLLPILAEVRSLGADFDMELLLCALTKFSAERKGADEILCATGLAGRFRTLPGRCAVNTLRCWLF